MTNIIICNISTEYDKGGKEMEKDMSMEEAEKIMLNICETAEIFNKFGIDIPIYECGGVFED